MPQTAKKAIKIASAIALITAIAAVYYVIDPAQHQWMPKCPSKLITGYDCPGCGSQRALHALLHGNMAQAWHYNRFLFIAVPYIALVAWSSREKLPHAAAVRRITHSPIAITSFITLFFLWWIIRNL